MYVQTQHGRILHIFQAIIWGKEYLALHKIFNAQYSKSFLLDLQRKFKRENKLEKIEKLRNFRLFSAKNSTCRKNILVEKFMKKNYIFMNNFGLWTKIFKQGFQNCFYVSTGTYLELDFFFKLDQGNAKLANEWRKTFAYWEKVLPSVIDYDRKKIGVVNGISSFQINSWVINTQRAPQCWCCPSLRWENIGKTSKKYFKTFDRFFWGFFFSLYQKKSLEGCFVVFENLHMFGSDCTGKL